MAASWRAFPPPSPTVPVGFCIFLNLSKLSFAAREGHRPFDRFARLQTNQSSGEMNGCASGLIDQEGKIIFALIIRDWDNLPLIEQELGRRPASRATRCTEYFARAARSPASDPAERPDSSTTINVALAEFGPAMLFHEPRYLGSRISSDNLAVLF